MLADLDNDSAPHPKPGEVLIPLLPVTVDDINARLAAANHAPLARPWTSLDTLEEIVRILKAHARRSG